MNASYSIVDGRNTMSVRPWSKTNIALFQFSNGSFGDSSSSVETIDFHRLETHVQPVRTGLHNLTDINKEDMKYVMIGMKLGATPLGNSMFGSSLFDIFKNEL